MTKILPIANNNIKNFLSKNKKNLLFSSAIALTLTSGVLTNSCSKITPLEKDVFEQKDSVEKEKKIEFVIDDSLNVIIHEIVI